MKVYDEQGNMCNDQASEVAQDIAAKIDVLFPTLFKQGMSLVEARALVTYINASLNTAACLCILEQQFENTAGETLPS